MTRMLLSLRTLAIAGLTLGATAISPASAGEADAAAFVTALAGQATEVLRDESMSLEARETHFRSLLNGGFALDMIARFVVGPHWQQMSPEQRADYQELYAEWVLNTYSAQLGGYSGQTFEVVKTVEAGKNDAFVRTRIIQPSGGAPIVVDWRVRRIDGRLRVIDIVVEGISMLVTQRSEFAAVLTRGGIDGLIEILRARVSKSPALSG